MLIKLAKQLLNLRLIILLGLVFLGPYSFAQTENGESSAQSEVQEDHDSKNLNKLLKGYNQDQEKVLEDAEKMIPEDNSDQLKEEELEIKNQKKVFDPKLFIKPVAPGNSNKIKYSEAMKVALEPLQSMSERELIKLLLENTKGSGAQDYIDRFPKLAVFSVRLIKDKNALPSFVKIADDQDKLIRFTGIMIATILVSFFLKRIMKRQGRPVWKAISLWFLRLMIMTSLRFAIILFFFSEEITPIFNIATKTFFNG